MAVDVNGHPAVPLIDDVTGETITMLTCCAECGQLRTILFLTRDRWFCTKCRAEGATAPNLYPIN